MRTDRMEIRKENMTVEQRLASSAEVAEHLGMSPGGLAKLRMEGKGPAFIRVNSRTIRYRWMAVEAWLDGRTHTTTDDYAA